MTHGTVIESIIFGILWAGVAGCALYLSGLDDGEIDLSVPGFGPGSAVTGTRS